MLKKKLGYLITIEGCDGTGKSHAAKHVQNYLCDKLKRFNIGVWRFREPGYGNDKVCGQIRELIVNQNYNKSDKTMLMLMLADRAQLWENYVYPKLLDGDIVIIDRHRDSTTVYQGILKNLNIDFIEILNNFITNCITPDLTILLEAPVKVLKERIKKRKADDDLEWNLDAVIKGYKKLQDHYPERIISVNSNCNLDTMYRNCDRVIDYKFKKLFNYD